jgi:anti-anti-sigma factor
MPTGGIRVELTRDDGVALATVRGEIDLDSSAQLNTVLNKVAKEESVILDMWWVTFMDSSGLAVLLRQAMTRRELGGALYIRHPSQPVRRLLEFCCLEHLLEPENEGASSAEQQSDEK